ncbi:hypothetical protein SLEP1_g47977 [Rubroshorea leprosula]|uniref:DUF4220 domain-containing protein n=1 Tax=Rubroshorea leprosula TaxID=152421 RepID=A0AAV5LV50_9ROSI|nr:hypothetical protein SLEP1_g47977 [Rubroshorea leprosula]
MLLFIAEHVEKLWDSWNIRGLTILSLLLQSFLILFAPLRRRRSEKWIIMIPLWIAYLFADWVATFPIAMRAERSDILAFWAPFLLLHLGGPDTITSFSLEDNEFWIRHLLGLILQVCSTIYVILQSPPHNKLWLPTLLVLIAGIIKYAERNRAFYLASFDHLGNNWESLSSVVPYEHLAMSPIPVQFEQANRSRFIEVWRRHDPWSIILAAACTIGATKSSIVGPPMTKEEQYCFSHLMENRDSHEMLRTIEIQLSLLYELLHTKLPIVDSKIGYICRTVNFGCILGALVSFSILLKKYYHNKFGEFDICLTYGLLIGALALDLISICLLLSSDWIICRQYSNKKNYDEFIDRRRWSNSVPQLNIFACRFPNKDGDYPNKLVDFLGTRFETIRRRIRCMSFKNFVEEQAWKLIFTMPKEKGIGVAGTEIFGPSRILTGHITAFSWTLNKFEHMDSLLIWHIATEICYQKECSDDSSSSSTSTSANCFDHRKICKLISDYMFYLLVMEPTTVATSPNNLKIVFEVTDQYQKWKWHFSEDEKGSKVPFIKDLEDNKHIFGNIDEDLLKEDVDKLPPILKAEIARFSRIAVARFLAKGLLNQPGGCPWELMGRFWVEILCYAAMNCQPIVHARQVSKGGQLLTLVWLLINYLGLTPPSMEPTPELFSQPYIASLKDQLRSRRQQGEPENF